MDDPNTNTLAGEYCTVAVTITNTAQTIDTLVNSAITALGYASANILSAKVLATQSGVVTARAAILFGGSVSQLGYLDAQVEREFPVRGGRTYLKRAAGSDVPAVIEVYLRK